MGGAKSVAPPVEPALEFVALSVPARPAPTPAKSSTIEGIRIEIKRGTLGINVIWPLSAAGECTAWLRELLR